MSKPSGSQYLESKVLTASQPRLHLMLLDGALRFGQQAKQTWGNDEEYAETDQFLSRIMDIVEELTSSVSPGEGEITKQLEEQYAFLYRELAACRINSDRQKFDECMKLLESTEKPGSWLARRWLPIPRCQPPIRWFQLIIFHRIPPTAFLSRRDSQS